MKFTINCDESKPKPEPTLFVSLRRSSSGGVELRANGYTLFHINESGYYYAKATTPESGAYTKVLDSEERVKRLAKCVDITG